MTTEQKNKVLKAINETTLMIEKFEKYSFEFRNHELIAQYKKHLKKLNLMLEKNELIISFN